MHPRRCAARNKTVDDQLGTGLHITPGLLGRKIAFGSLKDCVGSQRWKAIDGYGRYGHVDSCRQKPFHRTMTRIALVSREPLSFWGGYDWKTGEIIDRRHPLSGEIAKGEFLPSIHARIVHDNGGIA
ncbi:MAG: hypothetical protein U0X87_02420 [Anaerolineales bacterium]